MVQFTFLFVALLGENTVDRISWLWNQNLSFQCMHFLSEPALMRLNSTIQLLLQAYLVSKPIPVQISWGLVWQVKLGSCTAKMSWASHHSFGLPEFHHSCRLATIPLLLMLRHCSLLALVGMVIYPNFYYFPLIISQIYWFATTDNNAVGWNYSVQNFQGWGQIQQSIVYILPNARGITNTDGVVGRILEGLGNIWQNPDYQFRSFENCTPDSCNRKIQIVPF